MGALTAVARRGRAQGLHMIVQLKYFNALRLQCGIYLNYKLHLSSSPRPTMERSSAFRWLFAMESDGAASRVGVGACAMLWRRRRGFCLSSVRSANRYEDMWYSILGCLEASDVLAFSATDRARLEVALGEVVWRGLYARRFSTPSDLQCDAGLATSVEKFRQRLRHPTPGDRLEVAWDGSFELELGAVCVSRRWIVSTASYTFDTGTPVSRGGRARSSRASRSRSTTRAGRTTGTRSWTARRCGGPSARARRPSSGAATSSRSTAAARPCPVPRRRFFFLLRC